MTAQAGAVAFAWYLRTGHGDSIHFGTEPPECLLSHKWKPLYATPPAAVPVEALEGLVAELMARVEADKPQCTNDDGSYRSDAHRAAWNFADGLEHAADELTQLIERSKELIKERSNGQ